VDPDVIGLLLLPALLVPPVVVRRSPLLGAGLTAGTIAVTALPDGAQERCILALPVSLIVLFVAGSRSGLPRALAALALVLAGMVVLGITDPVLSGDVVGFLVFGWVLCAAVWGGGRLARSRDLVAAQLEERSALLERRRAQTAQHAVDIERTRLSADLDAAARDRVRQIAELSSVAEPTDPPDARARFAAVERLGRESLNDMRGLLGALRSDVDEARVPRPGLAQLDQLLDTRRATGGATSLERQGPERAFPTGLQLAAYRVLQHALEATDGRVEVVLRHLPDALELEVRGAPILGGDGAAALAAGAERVAAHGGRFTVAQAEGGRRTIHALLPV
jgi:signal transduction histidine kinase